MRSPIRLVSKSLQLHSNTVVSSLISFVGGLNCRQQKAQVSAKTNLGLLSKSWVIITMNETEKEQKAIALLNKFISEHGNDLKPIAHWGDGFCGFIAGKFQEHFGLKPNFHNEGTKNV